MLNPSFARCSFSIHLLDILETMITWCDFFIHFSLFYLFNFIQFWFTVGFYTYNRYPLYTCKDCLTYNPYLSYYLLRILVTIYGSCNQDPAIHVSLIQSISKCVAGIFSRFTIHDSIQDSVILDKFNQAWINLLYKIMMEWFDNYAPGCMCVVHKPHPFGSERRTICCGINSILCRSQIG